MLLFGGRVSLLRRAPPRCPERDAALSLEAEAFFPELLCSETIDEWMKSRKLESAFLNKKKKKKTHLEAAEVFPDEAAPFLGGAC